MSTACAHKTSVLNRFTFENIFGTISKSFDVKRKPFSASVTVYLVRRFCRVRRLSAGNLLAGIAFLFVTVFSWSSVQPVGRFEDCARSGK